jgi:hypothetical protein
MKQKTKKQLTYWLSVAIIGIAFGFGLQFVRAWTEPTQAPPGGNVAAPVNTGTIKQTKHADFCVDLDNNGTDDYCMSGGGGGFGNLNYNFQKVFCVPAECGCRGVPVAPKRSDASNNTPWGIYTCPNGWIMTGFFGKGCGDGNESYFINCVLIGSGESLLYNADHDSNACTSAGGEVVTVEGSVKICRFNQSSCPSGWSQYKNWSTTASKTCDGSCMTWERDESLYHRFSCLGRSRLGKLQMEWI